MAAPQGIPQQQHLLIASPQQYPQMSPPAYMPTTQPIGSTPPQAFMVTNNQQTPSAPTVTVPPGNLTPSSGNAGASAANTQQVAAESTSPAPVTAEPVVDGKVAENPQNWQTFQ